MKKNHDGLRNAAGACFIVMCAVYLSALVFFGGLIRWDRWLLYDGLPYLIYLGACLLGAISMFTGMPVLSAISCGINAFAWGIYYFLFPYSRGRIWCHNYPGEETYLFQIIALFALYWMLLTIASLWTKRAKIIVLPAAAIAVFRYICFVVFTIRKYGSIFYDYFVTPEPEWGDIIFIILIDLYFFILPIILPILMGFGLDKMPLKRPKALPVLPAQNAESAAERLTKLKEFLDSGIITQEEFDAKKAEILK